MDRQRTKVLQDYQEGIKSPACEILTRQGPSSGMIRERSLGHAQDPSADSIGSNAHPS